MHPKTGREAVGDGETMIVESQIACWVFDMVILLV